LSSHLYVDSQAEPFERFRERVGGVNATSAMNDALIKEGPNGLLKV